MIRKKYFSMLVGATFSSVINALLLIVDSIICGLMLGEDAVTAIGIVSPIYNFSVFIAMVLSLGIPILYSREVGNFRKKEADRVFGTGLLATIIGGVLIFVLMSIFRDAYLQQYDPSEALLFLSRGYFRWVRFELLLMPVAEVMYEMVFTDGDETCTTIVSIVETGSNIILSILLCRVMGIEGVALASFIAVCLRLLICMTHLLKESNTLHLNLCFAPSVFLKSCTLSLDDASSYLSLSAFATVLDIFVAWRFGSDMLIMAAMILTIQELALVFDGVGEAISPIITVYLSEDCYAGVRKVWRLAFKTAIVEGIALTAFLIVFSGWIPALLGITDPALVSMASHGIVLMSFGMIGVSFMYLLASYYLLLDEIILSVSLSILSDAISPILFMVAGGMLFGIPGVFIGIAVGSLMACFIALLFVFLRYGKENLPLMLADSEPGPGWRYDVKAVYMISLLNFKRDDISSEFRTDVALMDMKHKTLFSDKMRLIYLQLPYFTKELDDCETLFEKLIYVLKHMDVLQRMPWLAQDAVFQKLASIADVSSLNQKDRETYDENLRKYRDTIAVMEGQYLEGRADGRAEIARNLKKMGMSVSDIIRATGLTAEEINAM